MPTTSWSVTKLRLWAFVEVPLTGFKPPKGGLPPNVVAYTVGKDISYTEVVMLDVTQFASHWDLNSIPRASMQIAVGRRADDPSIIAAIHDLVDDMQVMLRCQVWMDVEERSNFYRDGTVYDPWPTDPFIVFDGYVVGTGFRRSRSVSGNEASHRLDLIHWLADLNFSSSLSRTSHQLNPAQYSFSAAFHTGGGVRPSFVSSILPLRFFAAPQVTTDFWGKSLMPWLKELCQRDRFNAPEVPPLAQDPLRGKNIEALRALDRFEPFNISNTNSTTVPPKYEFGCKLELDRGTLDSDAAARTMMNNIGRETVDTMASHTLWDKIVAQYGPSYLFSLVPMIDRALLVPFIPGLRTWWKTIFAEEYDAIEMSAEMPRPLRGIGIFTGRGSLAGGYPNQPGQVPTNPVLTQRVGGYYENTERRGGMVKLMRGPDWLTNLPVPYIWGNSSSAPGNTHGTSSNPRAGTPSTLPTPNALRQQAAPLWQRYAQSLYIMEVLKGRGGTLRSRLRFDIAPGSSVRIITTNEKFVAAEQGISDTDEMYGSVLRVSISADSEAMQAGTVFHVSYTRSAVENQQASYSISRHPLWKNVWEGAPLLGTEDAFLEPDSGGRMIGEDDPEVADGTNQPGDIVPSN